MERFVNVVRNKYLIAVAVFIAWMAFFDRYDLTTQYNYQQERKKLEAEKEYYTSEISTISTAIKDVKSNPDIIQKIAREKFKMKRTNEDVYIVEESTVD